MAKRGRPSKGERQLVRAKVPVQLAEAVHRAAADSPYASLTDYLTAVMADATGRTEYKPAPKVQQEELPLKTA